MSLIVPDAYDKLFCRCQGSGTSFVDDSTDNPKAITANGNATQLPIKFNKSAGFFNGTTDYVVIPNHADLVIGTADFNIEFFIFFNSASSYPMIYSKGYTGAGGMLFEVSSGKMDFYYASTKRITESTTISPNTWYHYRVRRTGGVVTMYRDGASVGTYSGTDDYSDTSDVVLGYADSYYFSGWMKELRIIKGSSTAVTVPTSEYTTATEANTVLLMHFDTPATSPLGPAIAFDGTGDYLTLADHADWDFGTGDFYVEFSFNPSAVASIQYFIDRNDGTDFRCRWNDATTKFSFVVGASNYESTAFPLVANRWYKIKYQRVSGTMTFYVDDAPWGTAAVSDNIAGSAGIYIGSTSGGTMFNGYMREIVINKAGTQVLYIKGNEDNGVTAFIDTAGKTVTTNGDTKIKYTEDYRSCIFTDETGKFPYPVGSAKVDFFAIGSGVGYFDGAGDYLSLADSADWDLGTGDFDLEAYVRPNALGAGEYIISADSGPDFGIHVTNAQIVVYLEGGAAITYAGTILVSTWSHLSVTRSGTALKLFLNGTIVGSATDSTDIQTSNGIKIGSNSAGSGNFINGLLDNIRISKGVARYTTTFNPPDDYAAAPSYNRGQFFALL